MASNAPFFRGQNVVLKFYQDNKPVYLQATNWDVEENATEVADGINGEKRDRLDKVTNFYSATVDVNQNDQEVLEAILKAQDEDDAANLPLKQVAGIQIEHRDGTRAAYILTGVKAGPFKMTMSGRSEAVKLNLKMRFQNFKKVPSI